MKKILNNLILATICFLTTFTAEFLFITQKDYQTLVPTKNYIALFVVLFIFSFISNRIWRKIAMNLILFLSFFQMMHISYYNIPVYPNAIWLMFTQAGEAYDTLIHELHLFFYPTLFVLSALIINIFMDKKLNHKIQIPFLHFLFLFYLAYNPIRTAITGNTWGRQPSTQEMLGMNVYLSLSYFSGKILPAKLSDSGIKSNHNVGLKLTKTEPINGNIIFVLGESLSANHLSLLGYHRKTTPFLDSLKDNNNFIYRRGISSGVSTDVSVAMIMNLTYGLNANKDILSGKQCIFNLAQKQNFETHFYSSQSEQQLRYITNSICLGKISNYKSLDHLDPDIEDHNAADDKILIEQLKKNMDESKSQFFVLHQRGSHSPYHLRYPIDYERYKIEGSYQTQKVNHYDNSVVYFDSFFKDLISYVDTIEQQTIIIYLSDHGEGLGEEGVWGHAALKAPSFEVPQFIYSKNMDIQKFKSLPQRSTNFNISLILAQLIGFDTNLDFSKFPMNYQILGNDLEGFAGHIEIE